MKSVTCSAGTAPANPPVLTSPVAGFEVRAVLDRDASVASGLMVGPDGRRAVLLVGADRFRPGQAEEFNRWAQALSDVASVTHAPAVIGAGATDDARPYLASLVEPSMSDHMRLTGQPDPHEIRRVAATVADVLATTHSYGIAHGTLSPAAIMVNGDRVLLGGFGATAPALASPVGMWPFAAPEHWRAAVADEPVASAGGDVFGLAATICVALMGAVPWSRPVTWADEAGLASGPSAPEWVSAVRDALRPAPDDRPNAEELAASLRRAGQSDEAGDLPYHGARADLRPLIPRAVRRLSAHSLGAMADDAPTAYGRAAASDVAAPPPTASVATGPWATAMVVTQAGTTRGRRPTPGVRPAPARMIRPRNGAGAWPDEPRVQPPERAPAASS